MHVNISRREYQRWYPAPSASTETRTWNIWRAYKNENQTYSGSYLASRTSKSSNMWHTDSSNASFSWSWRCSWAYLASIWTGTRWAGGSGCKGGRWWRRSVPLCASCSCSCESRIQHCRRSLSRSRTFGWFVLDCCFGNSFWHACSGAFPESMSSWSTWWWCHCQSDHEGVIARWIREVVSLYPSIYFCPAPRRN